ncbi:MAG: thioredoxin [Nannocystaceae bacterium]
MPLDNAASSTVLHTNEAGFEQEVIDSELPVLVDFWAAWCGPCRAIAPHLETLAGRFAGQAKVVKVDVDDNPGIAQRYGIRGIPTLLMFKGGKVVDQIVGNPGSAKPLEQLVLKHV